MNKKDLMGKTKKALVDMLKGLKPTSKEDKEVITYTLNGLKENSRNVTKPELVEILVDLFKSMTPSLLPVEGKIKNTKISEEEAEQEILNILDDEVKPIETKKKPVIKKSIAKKEEPEEVEKETTVTKDTTKSTSKSKAITKPKTIEVAIQFPDEFESEIGVLKMRDDIKNLKQFNKEYNEDGTDLCIGVFWNKRTLKQFDYDAFGILEGKEPVDFPNDLDLLQIYYVSDNVVYAISVYTECHYTFTKQTFNIDPDTNLRYSSGLEYQVYENLTEDDEEEE